MAKYSIRRVLEGEGEGKDKVEKVEEEKVESIKSEVRMVWLEKLFEDMKVYAINLTGEYENIVFSTLEEKGKTYLLIGAKLKGKDEIVMIKSGSKILLSQYKEVMSRYIKFKSGRIKEYELILRKAISKKGNVYFTFEEVITR